MQIAMAASRLPGGHFQLASPPAAWAAGGCVLWLSWSALRHRRLTLSALTFLWLAWGLVVQLPERPLGLQCTVLSVGHGVCVVIRLPCGDTMIYDAGRLGGGGSAARALQRCLNRRRIRRIRRLVISHQDIDHYNAVPELLESLQIDEICIGPRMLNADQPRASMVQALDNSIQRSGVPVRRLHAGQRLNWDPEVSVTVVHPPLLWPYGKADNGDSLVLRIAYRGRAILLTGDVEEEGLEALFQQRLDAEVLLAPHHGSPRSRPLELARHCGASWLIVSGGASGRPLLWDQGQTLHTSHEGAVRVQWGEAGLTVRAWRVDPW